MENFKREHYLKKIRPFINKQLIKVLTGQRRIGKSYILSQIKDEILEQNPNANIIFINLEKLEFLDKKNISSLSKYITERTKPEMNYLFIDEIQDVEGFENLLRSLVSEPNFDIYITGSNAKLLSGELATYLSGRQIEIRIYSLSFQEFLMFHKKNANQDSLNEFLKTGGMPYLINLSENEMREEYLRNIFNTIIFRDIISHYDIRDVTFLENLIRYIADNIGSLFSANNISKYLKSQNINKTTNSVISYLQYIENSFCVNRVKRFDIHGKRLFESGEKFYFEDLGLRNNIIKFNISDINKLIENVVYNHLKFRGYNVFVGNLSDYEIDFVAEKNGEPIYVQVAYLLNDEQTINREFGNLLKIHDNFPKYVISMDTISSQGKYKGIIHQTLLEFLQIQ